MATSGRSMKSPLHGTLCLWALLALVPACSEEEPIEPRVDMSPPPAETPPDLALRGDAAPLPRRPGCASDGDCGEHGICDDGYCRNGCRNDEACGPNAFCGERDRICMTCPEDADEPTETRIATEGRHVRQQVARILCSPSDVDRVMWVPVLAPGSFRQGADVLVIGAEANATTTFRVVTDEATESLSITGAGLLALLDRTVDGACSGDCRKRVEISASTTSQSPVMLQVRLGADPL